MASATAISTTAMTFFMVSTAVTFFVMMITSYTGIFQSSI